MYNVSGITRYYRYLSQKYSPVPVASRKRVLIVIGTCSVECVLTRGRGGRSILKYLKKRRSNAFPVSKNKDMAT
jgi:hypothetical protein